MAIDFWNGYDGSKREPRQIQKDVLEWIRQHSSSRVLALSLPTATGKSMIAKTLANKLGAHVITPSNVLVDQYSNEYTQHNSLKGKRHYSCRSGISCYDWTNVAEMPACPDCPYDSCKSRALEEPTFFNPMSLYYLTLNAKWETPRALVVDEAHQLPGMLSMLCGVRLPNSIYKFPKDATSELVLVDYLQKQLRKLESMAKYYAKEPKRLAEVTEIMETVRLTYRGLTENPQNYAIWLEKGMYNRRKDTFLNIKPIRPPRYIVKKLLFSRQLILMSGTLFKPDIEDLVGDQHYDFLDMPSAIPKENRKVLYRPTPFDMNYATDPKRIADYIETILAQHRGQNTIIHVTYSLAAKLLPHMKTPVLSNTSQNKDAVLDEFKRKGGVFLASGCAEGIDLKDDLCRVNIIPKMPYPDLSDPVVAKRKAAEGGQDWYDFQTFKTMIQQVGRSTRHERDYSTTYILDPNFARKFRACKSKLPAYFTESVVWGE
jgi:Rad3-related DNA helicase